MKHYLLTITLILVLILTLTGCTGSKVMSRYNTDNLFYIAYKEIDTVCDSPELSQKGRELLDALEDEMLLSHVVDTAIMMSPEVLGEHDHLVVTNDLWVRRFGDERQLKEMDFSALNPEMQEFLNAQVPVWLNDEGDWTKQIKICEYDDDRFLAFPVNTVLGQAAPIEARKPLILLVEHPVEVLRADGFLLPASSSGNILFEHESHLKDALEQSPIKTYGEVCQYSG